MKSFIKFFVLIFALALITSCSGAGGENNGEKDHRVRLVVPSGVTATSENPITVADGADAVFSVSMKSTVAFRSVSEGVFDPEKKTVTVSGVKKDISVELKAEDVGYDTTVKYKFIFVGSSGDKASAESGSDLYAGSEIMLNAKDEYKVFGGWSLNARLDEGGALISAEREHMLELSPDIQSGGEVAVYANYIDDNIMYYDPNGGEISSDSVNASHTKYYTAVLESNRLKVALDSDYYNAVGCAALFWDDSTFTRDGYVLIEYNTKADGSGEGYSLGSKFPMNGDTRTLYCIWAKDTPYSDFTYEAFNCEMPDGVSAEKAPHWHESGIKITSYKGNAETVVIPEKIDGKYVTAIGSGALTDKSVKTLVLSKYILTVESSALSGCRSLSRIYYPDSIYAIENEALDNESYKNLRELYVNATMAPRFQSGDGAFWLKFARFIANTDKPRIAVIAGSSTYQGLSSAYLEALLGEAYTVVNFGTTRTTQAYMYLEAMQYYANEEDIIVYAPENSIYMLGDPTLYWKTLRDMEGMYNIFRHIDISGYENVFTAFSELNRGSQPGTVTQTLENARYTIKCEMYEQAIERSAVNEYGEYQNRDREKYCNDVGYQDVYNITLNDRVKSILEGHYMNSDPNEDYNTSEKWCSITEERFVVNMNRAINAARSSGAKVYFSFCPVDADKICSEARADIDQWLEAYDKLISDTYDFDGLLGSSRNYIYNHKYFYNNAFHPNDYGRTLRTYTLYKDLCSIFGEAPLDMRSAGTDFEGCIFEDGNSNEPLYGVDYLN